MNQLTILFKKIYRSILLRVSNDKWYKEALMGNVYKINKSGAFISELDLLIPRNKFLFIFRSLSLLIELRKIIGLKAIIEDEKLKMESDIFSCYIETGEDVFILHEILVNGAYNFKTHESCIVYDIGMNVGYASLFFAKLPYVEHIYSFEPFIPTYKQALNNISLNPKLSKKITTHDFGLGNGTEYLKVKYSEQHRGRVGVFGTKFVRDKEYNESIEDIFIKKASDVLTDLSGKHNSEKIILKIDTEGSELNIINSLNENGFLSKVSVILMEWHETGEKTLARVFINQGFTVLSFTPNSKKTGMIYAFK